MKFLHKLNIIWQTKGFLPYPYCEAYVNGREHTTKKITKTLYRNVKNVIIHISNFKNTMENPALYRIKVWISFWWFQRFKPQKSINEPLLSFHFFVTFFSFSPSSVARAFRLSSVVMSRYRMVVSRLAWPRRKLICMIFIPSSSQWVALAYDSDIWKIILQILCQYHCSHLFCPVCCLF